MTFIAMLAILTILLRRKRIANIPQTVSIETVYGIMKKEKRKQLNAYGSFLLKQNYPSTFYQITM